MTDKPLHVLQVTGVMNRGGAEIMVMDLYRNISPNVRFDFLINVKLNNPRPQGDFDDEIVRRGGRLRYICTQWDLGIIKYIKQFKNIIEEIGKPDVVHIHLNSRCGVIALASKLCGIKKIIAHSHGDLVFKGPFFRSLPRKSELKIQKILIALFATDFWGCSDVAITSLFYRWIIKKGKTKIIYNAINVTSFINVSNNRSEEIRNTYGIKNDILVFGNVGRIVRRKNVDFIIDILKIFKNRNINFILIIAGRVDDKDYFDEINNKVSGYNLTDSVLYLGDRDDVPEVMSIFDVFVGPAHNEAFGMVAVESQAAGLPCVLSNEFPQNVDMGLNLVTFVDNYDPEKWTDIILSKINCKCTDKKLIFSKISECGFNAIENSKKIEKHYRS